MRMGCRVLAVCAIAGFAVLATGCQSFYHVTDPQSGRTYYTRRVQRGLGGKIKFMDAHTGSRVLLRSSEVKKITEGEFQTGLQNQ